MQQEQPPQNRGRRGPLGGVRALALAAPGRGVSSPLEAPLHSARDHLCRAHCRCPAWPRGTEDIRPFMGFLTSPFPPHPCASFD